jgi:hypothetical protein
MAEVLLEVQVLDAPWAAPSAAAHPADPLALPPEVRFVEGFPLWQRLGLAAVTGALTPWFLAAVASEHPESAAVLVGLALALTALTGFAAYATRLWTRVSSASTLWRWAAAAVLWIGEAALVLTAIAVAVTVFLTIIVAIFVIAFAGAVVASVFRG